MKILLYCYGFYPSLGGIETITETLARTFTKLGHECTVTTEIPYKGDDTFPFRVVRNPSKRNILKLMQEADVVCNIELSLKYFLLSKIARKPLIWVHNGYKLMCIDALGWYLDAPAPMTPWQSMIFYRKKNGLLYSAWEGFKLYCRRWASANIYCNVAATQWIGKRQPLSNQVQIYTPYPVDRFTPIADTLNKKYDFIYLGRLVPEKGIETLLRAFQHLLKKTGNHHLKLAIAGHGAAESYFKGIAAELGLNNSAFFLGPKKGKELIDTIGQAEIAIVPSHWEEPMGGVSLELMAAGRVMIVSKNGGMPEVVGEAGLTFTNGDWQELFQRMEEIVHNEQLKTKLKAKRKAQLEKFDTEKLTLEYLALFNKAVKKQSKA